MPSISQISSSVVPWAMIRPSFIIAFLEAMYSTSDTMWVEMSTIRSEANSDRRLRKRTLSPGSSPLVGSSRISTSGSFKRAWAMPTRRFIPPESFVIFFFLTSAREKVSRSRSIFSFAFFLVRPFRAAT